MQIPSSLTPGHLTSTETDIASAWRRSVDGVLKATDSLVRTGRIRGIEGSTLRAVGVCAAIGELCELQVGSVRTPRRVGQAEVIGVQGTELILSNLSPMIELSSRVRVLPLNRRLRVPVGEMLLGRVLNGFGQPIDELACLDDVPTRPIEAASPAALTRQAITQPLITGVRAIDAMLTCGQGQRVAILAPAGAGKSSLIGALARQCRADVVVVALVGERGREVGEFMREHLGPAFMYRTVVVAATSDKPAIERTKCALTAMTVAEHFRAQGKHVLLLVDSLTRLARAQRELADASSIAGRQSAVPGAVYSTLTSLIERAGTGEQGAISAFYTVLEPEGGGADPLSEEVRSLVDGHLVLSRSLADAGHFPAIDVLRSVSRVMPRLASPRHNLLARQLRGLLAKLESIELLIQVGEYRSGSDAIADRGLALRPAIEKFLQQSPCASLPEADVMPPTQPTADLNFIQAALESLLQS